MDVLYEPDSLAFRTDPYPAYARMREAAPVHRRDFERPGAPPVPVWVLPRWADCVAVLRDARFSARKNFAELLPATLPQGGPLEPLLRAYFGMMLFCDPPQHTRLRTLVNKAFTPRRVEALRPRVRALVAELVDARAARDELDVVGELAVPLPLIVIAELLGVPVEDRERLKRWSDHAAMLLDGTLRDEHLGVAIPGFLELVGYLEDVIEARRRAPRDDLVSALVAAQDEADALDHHEVVGTCALILGAGHETTTNLIGNGVLALLRDRAAFERLAADPGRIPAAVEELLRYDSPVQVTSRAPTEDVTLHGVPIPAGAEVNLLLGSANRDPAAFPDPDRLRFDRADNRHLAFGHGVHFCLGAPLARLEGQEAIRLLTQRFSKLDLALDPPPRRPGFVLRGCASLPVRLAPGRGAGGP